MFLTAFRPFLVFILESNKKPIKDEISLRIFNFEFGFSGRESRIELVQPSLTPLFINFDLCLGRWKADVLGVLLFL